GHLSAVDPPPHPGAPEIRRGDGLSDRAVPGVLEHEAVGELPALHATWQIERQAAEGTRCRTRKSPDCPGGTRNRKADPVLLGPRVVVFIEPLDVRPVGADVVFVRGKL